MPPDLWDRIQQEAIRETTARGKPISASALVRECVEDALFQARLADADPRCDESQYSQGGVAMYRQGDVLLIPTDTIPADATDVSAENGRVVLAHGEATGHHHSFAPNTGVTLCESEEMRFLSVAEEANLTHQEHATIPIAPGLYRVIRQREYDDMEEWRNVAD